MSKLCSNCGAQIADNANFCKVCGAKQSTVQANAHPSRPAKKGKFLFGIVAMCAATAILAAALLFIFGDSYKKPIETSIAAVYEAKYDKLEKLAPEEYWDFMEDKTGKTADDLVKICEEQNITERLMATLEGQYGDNVKVSYEITDKSRLKKSELSDIKDALDKKYGISKRSVKTAYTIEFNMIFKGDSHEKTEQTETVVVKIDGKWYPLNDNNEFDVPLINFIDGGVY